MALVFGRLILAFILAMAAVAVIAPRPAPAADMVVILDRAALLKLPPNVATIVVGNPLIADVSLQPGNLMVVTGKGYGTTNLIAVDRGGNILMDRSIEVQGAQAHVVAVYRGSERESYSCTPICERQITLGDSRTYFDTIVLQTSSRSGIAQGQLTPSPAAAPPAK
jgi:hypothetical protein